MSPISAMYPVSPWTCSSGSPPTLEEMTGTSQAIASSAGKPEASDWLGMSISRPTTVSARARVVFQETDVLLEVHFTGEDLAGGAFRAVPHEQRREGLLRTSPEYPDHVLNPLDKSGNSIPG